jgi:phenylpyruvate tautomerase PptA (4-oxalocrotonate tautomerase family)
MAQVTIYGRRDHFDQHRPRLSETIHQCLVEALALPPDKRFQRFIGLATEDFLYPPDRSEQYTIIEISMFEGRTTETKKQLIRLLFARLAANLQIAPQDVEITIFETPRAHWGIRGQLGDELHLNYTVEK